MAEVLISGLSKAYGAQKVLGGIDIAIPDGAFVVLVGPSGCGKSTLLRMIAGLEDITGGTIAIGGRVVNDLPPKERDISMVFQNYALYPHMTVAENMAFSLTLAGADKATKAAAVARAAAILDLGPLLDRKPRALSGGQRQRVAMGRAILRDPAVFLFDEPLSNLDAKLRVAMRAEIKALHQRLGTTMVYVTHDQVEAMTMADRIVVMNGGRIEQEGPPLELYDRPANVFVAGFIGSPAMNLLSVEGTGQGLRLGSQMIPHGGGTGPLTLGIRPEHLALVPEGLPATVQVVEPTGAETQVLMEAEGQPVTAVFRHRPGLRPGDRVHLAPEPGQMHLFGPDGRRI